MKHIRPPLSHGSRVAAALVTAMAASPAWAQLTIPGADGVDGALNVTANTTINLATQGTYDPDKWAVVFRYTSVNIASGATLSFTNHPKGAPVVWLVSGNVTINGTLNLSGANALLDSGLMSQPGPGGFPGGRAKRDVTLAGGAGAGPGGGNYNEAIARGEGDGSYATLGSVTPTTVYGNVRILPLIGGSGGAGDNNSDAGDVSGGAGGGGILIASVGTVSINGSLSAKGGLGGKNSCCSDIDESASGSGGAIRIVTDTFSGSGTLNALGGNVSNTYVGGKGRIRIEAQNYSPGITTFPDATVATPDTPVVIWPPAAAPSAKIMSVAAATIPADPTGYYADTGTPDAAIPNTASTINAVIQTANVDPAAVVTVRVIPKNGAATNATAAFSSGDATQATWTATFTPPDGLFYLQARAVNPQP